MKTVKLIIGIMSIVLCLVVMLQSCAAGVVDAIEDQGATSGSSGMILGIVLLIAGICAVATRKSKLGGIITGLFYLFGALIGFSATGSYAQGDLVIWKWLCLIFGIVFIVGSFGIKKSSKR